MSMCRVISCDVGRECLLWPVRSLDKTLLAFALLHSVLQGQICLLLQVSLDFLLLLSSINWWAAVTDHPIKDWRETTVRPDVAQSSKHWWSSVLKKLKCHHFQNPAFPPVPLLSSSSGWSKFSNTDLWGFFQVYLLLHVLKVYFFSPYFKL